MRTRLRSPVLALLLLVPACATAARAQAVEFATLRLDNDILALRGREAPPDYDYTHGLHLAAGLGSAQGRARLGVGQRIYTPRRDAPTPLPGERPYAAWLYASAELSRDGPGRERSLGVELGVTGRPALGEPVQNGVHRLLGSERQRGWAHQLGFEPGVVLRYGETFPLRRRLPGAGTVRLAPAWAVSLGNVRTAAEAGGAVRLGADGGPGPYGGLGLRQEWVLRDLFLDGSSFRESARAEKLPLVTEGEAGVGYRFRRWSLEYRFVVRGREYRAQPGPHRYGSLALTRHR